MKKWKDYIPATMERIVAANITFRPIRSWHSLTYAGEGLQNVNGDGSGCVHANGRTCNRPLTVTHRIYTNTKTGKQLSSFLSYPDGMGAVDVYFWEIFPIEQDIERFESEYEMERRVIDLLSEPALSNSDTAGPSTEQTP